MRSSSKRSRGFTLVELIIVIIIIGIIATLAIPQFIDSTTDAQEATLAGDLAVLRNAINLYYHQHSSTYPGAVKEDGTGDATTDGAVETAALTNQLTQYTNADGLTSASLDRATYPFGPYLMTGLPDDPVAVTGSDLDGVEVTDDASALTADADPATGWKYSKVSGQVISNNATYEAW